MKWVEIVLYLKFPFQCSCGETAHDATQAFEHYRCGHVLHHCPECGGKLKIPSVKGEFGCVDHSKYACYGCGKVFDKDTIRRGEAAGS